jgi:hypothetical protein
MAFQGSSRLLRVIKGNPGPAGAAGATGATGATGETGGTGGTGPTGNGVSGAVSFESGVIKGITFTLTDGTTFELIGFTGTNSDGTPTDFSYTITNENQELTDHAKIFKGFRDSDDSSPKIAQFRTLRVQGNRVNVLGVTQEMIILEGITLPGKLGEVGRLVYLNAGNSASSSTDALTTFSGNTFSAILDRMIETGINSDNYYGGGFGLPTWDLSFANNWIMPANRSLLLGSPTFNNYAGFNQSLEVTGGNIHGWVLPKNDLYEGNITLSESSIVYRTFQLKPYLDIGTGDNDTPTKFEFERHQPHTITMSLFNNTVGSCCFCSSPDIITGKYGTKCVDYMTKSYCESILGTFGTTACALRDEGPECQDTVPCCLNGICTDTSLEKCEKFNGIAFENIVTCAALGTCPDICPGQNGACCVNGVCYSFNQENCEIVGGIFHSGKNCDPYNRSENPNGYNCCLDSFPGACCISRDPRDDEVDDDNPPVPGTNCYNNYTALQCYQANGHYQGAGSSCYATDDDDNPNDLVLVGIDPSGNAILRRCCEDPCDPGDPNCIDTVNESCQIQFKSMPHI